MLVVKEGRRERSSSPFDPPLPFFLPAIHNSPSEPTLTIYTFLELVDHFLALSSFLGLFSYPNLSLSKPLSAAFPSSLLPSPPFPSHSFPTMDPSEYKREGEADP